MHGKLLAHKAVHKMRAIEATRKKKKPQPNSAIQVPFLKSIIYFRPKTETYKILQRI